MRVICKKVRLRKFCQSRVVHTVIKESEDSCYNDRHTLPVRPGPGLKVYTKCLLYVTVSTSTEMLMRIFITINLVIIVLVRLDFRYKLSSPIVL
jgi:hypothetical protein